MPLKAKLDLRRKLLLSTVGSLCVGVVLIVVIVAALLITGFPDWIESTEDAMITAESDNLQRLSVEKAEFVDAFFMNSKANLEGACVHMEDLLRGAAPLKDQLDPQFSTLDDDHPDGYEENAVGPTAASLEDLGWYLCSQGDLDKDASCGDGVSDVDDLNPTARKQLDISDGMQLYYKALFQSGFPVVPGGFFAVNFKKDGLVRLFPYQDLTEFLDWEIPCDDDDGSTIKDGYDPRCRPWWDGATAETSDIFFTSPFSWVVPGLDTTVLGITAAKRFHNFTGTNKEDEPPGKLIAADLSDDIEGVCAFEPPLEDVDRKTTASLSHRGYGYMVTQAGELDGRVSAVLHPDLEFEAGEIAEGADIRSLEDLGGSEREEFTENFLRPMIRGERGTGNFQKNGENWYIAYHNVSAPQYSLALVIPEEDIREPFRDARNQIDAAIGAQVGIIVAVLVVLLVIMFMYARRISASIEEPVKLLLGLVKRINNQNFQGEEVTAINQIADEKYLSRELASLDKTFRQMYLAIKVGQSSFLSGDMNEAEKTFMDAMALFARLGHEKGLGVCHTNLGAIYVGRRAYTQAISSYEDAIRNVEEMLEDQQKGGAGNESLVKTLASRQLNLAKAFESRAHNALETHWPQRFVPQQTYQTFPDADPPVSIDQSLDDLQEACRLSHESLRTLLSHNPSFVDTMEARCDNVKLLSLYAEVIRISNETGAARPKAKYHDVLSQAEKGLSELMQEYSECEASEEDEESLNAQKLRALAAQGDLLMAKGQIHDAVLAYHQALTSFGDVDIMSFTDVVIQMSVALKCLGYHRQAEEAMSRLPNAKSVQKDFIFLLDNSGSMAGGLIRKAVDNMVALYDDHVDAEDRLSVYTFSTTVSQRIRMVQKGSGKEAEATRRQMLSLTRAGGLTACYDAIWNGLDNFKTAQKAGNRMKVIVCLTDGDDNMSKHVPRQLISRFRDDADAQDVMLIIIAVGRLKTADTLRQIAQSSKDGQLVEAKNGLQDLDEAFKQVSKLIAGSQFTLESL